MWYDMFVAGVPLAERALRSVIVYAFAVIALRLAGKRELGQLTTFDLVVLLFFSNVLQNSIIGADNSITGGVVGAATLLLVNHLVVRLLYDHERIDELVEGQATSLIKAGVIDETALRRELITREELLLACHKQGIVDISQVESAILEPDGTITVFAKLPTSGELERQEILQRLADLQGRVEHLTALLETGGTRGLPGVPRAEP